MSVRFNVAELAGVVAKTLSSIDMRTASVLVDGKWQNVMTVIRLLCESTVEASANVEQIWGTHGPVHTDEFRIDSRVVAFTEWGALSAEFDEGRIRFAETEVELGRAVDVKVALGYVQTNYSAIWPQPVWPMLEASVNTISTSDASKNPQ